MGLKSLRAKLLYDDYYKSYRDNMLHIIDYYLQQNKRIATWGYGLKGESFIRIMDRDGKRISCTIDLKKDLIGKKTLSNKNIISYNEIGQYEIDIILLMNKVHYVDVNGILNTEGYKVKLVDVDDLIENEISLQKFLEGSDYEKKQELKYDLNELHGQVMIIMKEIDRICKKHQIGYFLCAGSALGAQRHKGFIPWDEDIDVGMLRSEYQHFIEVIKTDLGEDFLYHTIEKGLDYYKPFVKIYKNNTSFVRYEMSEAKMHHGIHIDIFPFDNVPADSVRMEKQAKKVKKYMAILFAKLIRVIYQSRNPINHLIVNTKYYLYKFIPLNYLNRKLEAALRMYEHENTGYVADLCCPYTRRKKVMYFKLEDIIPYKLAAFEDQYYPVPNNQDAYLTMMYGDYMTPPPEGKRLQKYRLLEVSYNSNYYRDNMWLDKWLEKRKSKNEI